MRKSNKKCICKKCEDCNFFLSWDMTEQKTGLRKNVQKCGFQVLFEEIPFIRGSIDGAQQGSNEANNRAMETQNIVKDLGLAMLAAVKDIPKQIGVIEHDSKRLPYTKGQGRG